MGTRTVGLKTAIVIIVVWTAAFIGLGVTFGYPKAPQDAQGHLNLGWTYYQQGNKAKALREYEKALSLDKNNIEAMYRTGLVQKDLAKYRDAEANLKQVLKLNPSHKSAAFTLAQVYRELGQYDQARNQYLEALELSPASADIMAELGLVYEAQNKNAEALAQYRNALRLVPDLKIARDGLKRTEQR